MTSKNIAPSASTSSTLVDVNPLQQFFDQHHTGRGIFKWQHYFEIYHRHFKKFRATEVHVLEIGVYSGGSLDLWRDYFGARAQIYGVDLAPGCKALELPGIRIFIGDQEDRNFWKQFRNDVPLLDIVVDDGGHTPEQQTVSMEELLPHLRPGGVYLCEDIHGVGNKFARFVYDQACRLNAVENLHNNFEDHENRLSCSATDFQSSIASISLYPFVAVVEKRDQLLTRMSAPKRGSEWIDGGAR